MMRYNFDEMIDRRGSFATKLEKMPALKHPDPIAAWIADMDFAAAPPITEALSRLISGRIFGYTEYDVPDMKKAIIGWYRRRHGWTIEQSDIFYSPSVVPAISFCLNFLTNEGDGVIIQPPVYRPFREKVIGNGRLVMNNPLSYVGGRYEMNFDELEQLFASPKSRGMILCNPHNPCGRVWSKDELRAVVDLAKKYDKWIISDEIHMDLTRKGISHNPLLKIAPDQAQRIISCTSPSKTFNLAGAQLANCIIPNKQWQQQWLSVIDNRFSVDSASPFGVVSAIAAYNNGDDWLNALQDYLDETIALVKAFVDQHLPKAHLVYPEACYLLWLDLSGYESDCDRLCSIVKDRAGLALIDGRVFGAEGAGFQRINIATPRQRVMQIMHRLKDALIN